MKLYEELKTRGLIAQCTDEKLVSELIDNGNATFYIGFDPTADSLHAGSFLQLVVMAHLQRAGNKPIVVIGGGTATIGDPSGRTDMRKMLTAEQIKHNGECFVTQMENMIDFSEGKAIMLNNANWLLGLNYIDFLKNVGAHFSVNRMLTAECFKTRLEKGLSFIEFNYMLMQSYDFLYLFKEYGCVLELGGDDQWSNILGGTELIRRSLGKDSHGLTFNLLTTAQGTKMGKTASGAVWLDKNKTTPFEFYQYFRNVADIDTVRFLKMLTFVPLKEIANYERLEGSDINKAKERLAFEVTKLVHGEEEAKNADTAAKALFSQGSDNTNMPTVVLSSADFSADTISILDLLIKAELAPSKGEGRRLVQQGGVFVNDEKVTDFAITYSIKDFENDFIIKKGKKNFVRIML